MEIDIEKLTPYSRGLVELALREQRHHDAREQKREADKSAAIEAAKLTKEITAATYPADMSEIDRLQLEVDTLDAKIDAAGIDRRATTDGAGAVRYNPLVAMLRQAKFRLKVATDARDRVAAATGFNLFGRSL